MVCLHRVISSPRVYCLNHPRNIRTNEDVSQVLNWIFVLIGKMHCFFVDKEKSRVFSLGKVRIIRNFYGKPQLYFFNNMWLESLSRPRFLPFLFSFSNILIY